MKSLQAIAAISLRFEIFVMFPLNHSCISPQLAIVTALACEAKPIINFYKLKKLDKKMPFPIYHQANIFLIVSGIGKINSALAVAILKSLIPDELIWLNLGIAGHRNCDIGSIFMANKIVDHATMRAYYPTFLTNPPIPSSTIRTVDQPESGFVDGDIYEMEASGFMQAALKFSTIEYVHCCKIISDNLNTRICFNSQSVQKLIDTRMLEISKIVEYLKRLQSSSKASFLLNTEEFIAHRHFTVTEKHQLERLLARIACLNIAISNEEFKHLRKAKEVLVELENKINLQPLIF